MELKAMPHYFIVRIEIEKQKERKEKIGSLYVHASHTFMERNLQCGEIVSIGSIAGTKFKEAKVGDTLLIHHFVEKDSNLISSCENYNYYNCTASEYQGRRNESYGINRDGEIIPHPDFVFIETEKKKEIKAEEFEEEVTEQVGSLILFKNWEEKRTDKEAKATRLLNEIKQASKGKSISESTKHGLEEKQRESELLTLSLNKKEYKEFKVAFAHNSLNVKSKVYALSMAVQTILEVNGIEYFVVQTKYVAATS